MAVINPHLAQIVIPPCSACSIVIGATGYSDPARPGAGVWVEWRAQNCEQVNCGGRPVLIEAGGGVKNESVSFSSPGLFSYFVLRPLPATGGGNSTGLSAGAAELAGQCHVPM